MRFFPVLLRELMEDFLDLDSRFMRTLKPLLFQPGKLTRDYLSGRRFRYTPPLRLYIFSSMAFFILAAMLAGNAIEINTDGVEVDELSGLIYIDADDEREREKIREALNKLDPSLADKLVINVDGLTEEASAAKEPEGKSDLLLRQRAISLYACITVLSDYLMMALK